MSARHAKRILGLFRTEGSVAACTATAGNVITALDLFRQREEFLRLGFRAVDQFLRNAMVADHCKAELGKAAAKLFGNVLDRLVERYGCNNTARTGLPVPRSSDWRGCLQPAP